jgi:UDP-N-acetylmuramate--alanine ligase
MLAELMRLKSTVAIAGTHGKTTTTSMVAALLDAGGVDPTVINGGIINSYGSNARLGASDWMVVEADESDGSFLRLDGTIAVVTNIDPEHLDHYGSFERVKQCFVEFIENVPFYGAAVLCIDHPEVQAIIPKVRDRRVITYGFSAQADVRGEAVTPIPAATASPPSCASVTGRSAGSRVSNCPCPGATMCRTLWRRSRWPWKWVSATRSSGAVSPSSGASSAASPRWARWTAPRSSTITVITRSKSALFWPPRAKACRAG